MLKYTHISCLTRYCPALSVLGIVNEYVDPLAVSRSVAAHRPAEFFPDSATLNHTALVPGDHLVISEGARAI